MSDGSAFITFVDLDGDVMMVSITAIQAVTWSDRQGYGLVAIHGRCPTRIDKTAWLKIVNELSSIKI